LCPGKFYGVPPALADLDLYSNHFEQQRRNMYDVCLAPDVLNARTVSMRYGGWDTHNNQISRIGNNLEDLFGSSGGLATSLAEIAGIVTDGPPAQDQLPFCFSSDFGRQLRANGDNGTDHGRGIYTVVAGNDVNGGVYGKCSRKGNRCPMATAGYRWKPPVPISKAVHRRRKSWLQPVTGWNRVPK
jgi:hypothetical protein